MGTANRREFLRGAAALAASSVLPARFVGGQETPAPTLKAQRLAWAGVRLQLGKSALFIDPLISPEVWGKALPDPLVPVEGVEGARYVLITHRHNDHFDRKAAKSALGEAGTFVCTPDAAPAAAAAGLRVRPVALYEPALLGDFTATPVPAADGSGDPQVSWVVSGGGRRIIHCGDTLWHGHWWQIGRQHGPFDAAFLPINGALFLDRKPPSGIPAVMTPDQAVAAAAVLGARLIVPIHYGVVGDETYAEVAGAEAALLKAAGRRGVGVEIVKPGDWLSWQPRG